MEPGQSLWEQITSSGASILYSVFTAGLIAVINHMNKMRKRLTDVTFIRLVIIFCMGALNGYVTFLLCDAAGYSWQVTAIFVGGSGALGGELLRAISSKMNLLKKEI